MNSQSGNESNEFYTQKKQELLAFKQTIRGKRIAVLGIGISNTPLIRVLSQWGADITAFDRSEPEALHATLGQLQEPDIKYCLGKDYLAQLHGFDYIFKTPVIRHDIPQLLEEQSRGAIITSEMAVFLAFCPARVFAVTGSDGKTTTTTLIHRMLTAQGYRCLLGGNIGTPLLDRIDEIGPDDRLAVELSSFQLQAMVCKPAVSLITNITPNHLDVHKSYEEYIEAKANVFLHQPPDSLSVLNYDCELTRRFSDQVKGDLAFFSLTHNLRHADCHVAAYLEGDRFILRCDDQLTDVMDIHDILLPGRHNIDNYLAAACAVALDTNPGVIAETAKTFPGVEHRIEAVRELDGVTYYNDSIASSPNRTIACLNSFSQRIILLAGGKDKNLDYSAFGSQLADHVKLLLLCGQNAPNIKASLSEYLAANPTVQPVPVYEFDDYGELVRAARNMAAPGDIVVLSPAGTSFDRFRNFEERGSVFKSLVHDLI